MNLDSLPSQTNQSSPISNELLLLDPDSNPNENLTPIGGQKTSTTVLLPNDLLIFNSDNDKVAVRITSTDLDTLLPELTNLGFETLGLAAEFNIIEGFIGLDTLSSLEDLTDVGLLGVIPIYQPITNEDNSISQPESNDNRLVIENDSLISDTGNDSLDDVLYEQDNDSLIPSCDNNDNFDSVSEMDILAGEIENNPLILELDITENHTIVQDYENEVICSNLFDVSTNEIELDISNF